MSNERKHMSSLSSVICLKMATQDTHKLSSVLRSIEVIESKLKKQEDSKKIYSIIDKANTIYSEYTLSNNDIDRLQSILIDDTNIHLQMFFQHLEKLLQIDLKSIKQ